MHCVFLNFRQRILPLGYSATAFRVCLLVASKVSAIPCLRSSTETPVQIKMVNSRVFGPTNVLDRIYEETHAEKGPISSVPRVRFSSRWVRELSGGLNIKTRNRSFREVIVTKQPTRGRKHEAVNSEHEAQFENLGHRARGEASSREKVLFGVC